MRACRTGTPLRSRQGRVRLPLLLPRATHIDIVSRRGRCCHSGRLALALSDLRSPEGPKRDDDWARRASARLAAACAF